MVTLFCLHSACKLGFFHGWGVRLVIHAQSDSGVPIQDRVSKIDCLAFSSSIHGCLGVKMAESRCPVAQGFFLWDNYSIWRNDRLTNRLRLRLRFISLISMHLRLILPAYYQLIMWLITANLWSYLVIKVWNRNMDRESRAHDLIRLNWHGEVSNFNF